MTQLLEQFKMETNFEGLIHLLAKSMYAEPDVFVRELIQNAHDSIIRRREVEPDLAGHIDIDLDMAGRTITFRDNGLGMDCQDIKMFLSVIGSTGTGEARERLSQEGKGAAYNLIGQFGIGMLSAFVVAESVVVKTRKLNSTDAFAWHNSGSTDCQLFSDDRKDPGSEIIVTILPNYSYVLDEKHLREAIVKYCDFVPFPIRLNGIGPENSIDAPWHREHWTSAVEKEATYKNFLNRRYPDIPLDVIPIEVDEPYKARGALYISNRRIPDISTTGVIDIFVRRIFVLGDDRTLLPPWAKFVRGIIDSPDLQPTASRDNIQRNHPAFEFLQKRLGELIVERLAYLARYEPGKFRQINIWHHYHLKGMAYYHRDFFDQVADLLLFQTNRGDMSLRDYLGKHALNPEKGNRVPIYYFGYRGGAAQAYKLADAQGWVAINAGGRFEEELLEEYGKYHPDTVYLERLDATDNPVIFQRLDQSEQEQFRQLELDLEGHLRRLGVGNIHVEMRRFAPAELPAALILTPETEAEEKLRGLLTAPWFMEGFEEIARETLEDSQRRPIYLRLNAASPLIKRLAGFDRQSPLLQEIMGGVYNSAILYSHNLLTQNNAEIMHGQFVRLFENLLQLQERMDIMGINLEDARRQALEMRQQQTDLSFQRPEHILLFMITPFSDEYRPIEEAVRRVFERPPFYCEVQLARDYTHTTGLLANVREHMLRAHGFIAEISDLNPNVMFELGAVMLADTTRPMFCLRSSSAQQQVPADLRHELYVPYGAVGDPVPILEEAIRNHFQRDGRIVHDQLNALLAQRRKRFLSRTLLENLDYKLNQELKEGIMRYFRTVEDLVAATPEEVTRQVGLQNYAVLAIQGQLQEALRAEET